MLKSFRSFSWSCLFLLSLSTVLHAQPTETASPTGVLEGVVIDRMTKQEIVGAKLQLLDTPFGTTSDVKGRFRFSGLPAKTYRLKVTALDYKPLVRSDVFVGSVQSTKLTIELQLSETVSVDEVTVTADMFFTKQADLKVSTNTLSQEEVRRAPGAVEDVSRMVLILPGVSSSADNRNDLVVRGGSPIENFIFVDGIEVPNINHFGTQGATGGPIGMIDVNFLQEVNFSAGGFSARFGDRLSSVMDIRYREGDKSEFRGKFDLGFAGAGFQAEGPLQKGEGAFMISARKSYLDLLIGSTGLTAVPNYSNLNLKASFQLSPKHRFSLVGLGGIDDIYFKDFENEDAPTRDNIRNNGWQYVIGIVHKWLVSEKTFIQTSLSHNQYRFFTNVDSARVFTFYRNSSFEREYLLRSDFSHRFSPTDLFEAGITLRAIDNQNAVFLRSGSIGANGEPAEGFDYDRTGVAQKFGAYVQYTKDFFARLSLTAGVRYDYFSYLNAPHAVSPRLAMSYALRQNLKLNFAAGIYHQSPAMVWLIADARNRNLKYAQSQHFVGGFEYFPAEDLKISVEAYYKRYLNYAASVAIPQLSYANAGANFGTFGTEELVSESTGYARGVDFFLQKKLSAQFYAILGYTISDIQFAGRDGILRPSAFDFRHIFTAIGGWKFSDALEVSAKWRFSGGKPYTPIDLVRARAVNQLVFDFNRFNANRFQDYHRLDLRLDWRNFFDGWNMVSYVEIQNVYNRQNPFTLIWNQRRADVEVVNQWAFLPVGGVKIEF
ncbi:MAG: TonB-dependent receptor [Chloroherpetonaceae bacterium]